MNFRTYNKELFFNNFIKTDTYRYLNNKYHTFYSDTCDLDITGRPTPGYTGNFLNPHRVNLRNRGIFIYSFLYYIDMLLETDPKLIADVGCALNEVKEYIPGVVGFDFTKEADVNRWFDDQFIEDYFETFDSAFAINSIQFVPINELSNRINKFGKIIKPNGRGFVTFSLFHLINLTDKSDLTDIFGTTKYVSINEYYDYVVEEIKKIRYNIISLDILFNSSNLSAVHNNLKIKYDNLKGNSWPSFDEYINDYLDNKIDWEILNEIKTFDIPTPEEIFEEIIHDQYNGNIRIVFEK